MDETNPFYVNANYRWIYNDSSKDYGDAFDYVSQLEGGDSNWRQLLEIRDQWLGGVVDKNLQQLGSAGILIFYRWFLLKNIIDNNLLNKYDRFIITRSDYIYLSDHAPIYLLHPDFIWMPEGENYGGFSDRHIVVSPKKLINSLNLMDDIIHRPYELKTNMSLIRKEVGSWNLEKAIYFHFMRNNLIKDVRIFPRTMFAGKDVNTSTSWGKGIYKKELGYYIKYQGEYDSVIMNSKLSQYEWYKRFSKVSSTSFKNWPSDTNT